MDLCEQNGNILYILNVLKKYSNKESIMKVIDIQNKVEEEYGQKIDVRTIRRNINLLKEKFGYNISTFKENGKGYYIEDVSNEKTSKKIYDDEKIKKEKIYYPKEEIMSEELENTINELTKRIKSRRKIKFDYWKYCIVEEKIVKKIVDRPYISPVAIAYYENQYYLIGIQEKNDEIFHYNINRIRNIKESEDKVKVKIEEKEIEKYIENSVKKFNGQRIEVIAECDEYLLGEVIEKFGKKIKIKPISKNKFQFIIEINENYFKKWVLKNLDLCTIIRPRSLEKEIKEIIENANKRYK